MTSVTNRIKAGLSAASALLSGTPADTKEAAEILKEEPVKPARKPRKKVLTKDMLNSLLAPATPARRIGSNSKLSSQEQVRIKEAAVAKRERRMKRTNGWSAS